MDKNQLLRLKTLALTGQAINPASFPDVDEAVLAEKALAFKSDANAIQTRDYTPPETYAVQPVGDRSFDFVISTDTPDHGGDIIKQSGLDLAVFKTNPVVLWAHDGRTRPPVGTAKNLRRNQKMGNGARGTIATVELAPEGTSDFTDALFRFVEAGIVRAASVGIKFLELGDIKDDKERAKLGLGRFGLLIKKSRLLEFSLVSIPQNPEALGKAADEILTKGLAPRAGVEEIMRSYPITERDQARMIDELFKEYHHLGSFAAEPDGAGNNGTSDPEATLADRMVEDLDEVLEKVSSAIAAAVPVEGDGEAASSDDETETKGGTLTGKGMMIQLPDAAPIDSTFTVTSTEGTWVQSGAAAESNIVWKFIAASDEAAKIDRLESALSAIEQITTKQNEAILSLGDLVEQLSLRAERPPIADENVGQGDLEKIVADAFRSALDLQSEKRSKE